jgi:toxin ParE1/3/4
MRIVWQREACDDLRTIVTYVREDNPDAARRIYQVIQAQVKHLAEFPYFGREGRVDKTRELIIAGLPYIVAYYLVGQEVRILAVVHTSRKWPENFPID